VYSDVQQCYLYQQRNVLACLETVPGFPT